MYQDRFGFLPERLDVLWEWGQVRTLEQFDKAKEWLTGRLHPDTYYYPPTQHTRRGWPPEEAEVVPNSERPALLHRVPATHELVLSDYDKDESLRTGIAGFIVHFLGFLLGHRVQFDDWWMDGRLPSRCQSDAPPHSAREVSVCLDVAVATWMRADDRAKRVLTNAIFMHNRAPSYEWSWERFIIEYQVFDALFRVAVRVHGVKDPRVHADRFAAFGDAFGLHQDAERIATIVQLRNDLFHETLWVGGTPTGDESEGGYYGAIWLQHINQRMGLAVLGFSGSYVRSEWASLLARFLDLDDIRLPA